MRPHRFTRVHLEQLIPDYFMVSWELVILTAMFLQLRAIDILHPSSMLRKEAQKALLPSLWSMKWPSSSCNRLMLFLHWLLPIMYLKLLFPPTVLSSFYSNWALAIWIFSLLWYISPVHLTSLSLGIHFSFCLSSLSPFLISVLPFILNSFLLSTLFLEYNHRNNFLSHDFFRVPNQLQ